MNVWNNTTASDCGLDKTIKLLIAANSKLQMPRRDALHLEILTGVTCKLEDLRSKVLKNSSGVDGSSCPNTLLSTDAILEMAVDSTDWELKTGTRRAGYGLFGFGRCTGRFRPFGRRRGVLVLEASGV